MLLVGAESIGTVDFFLYVCVCVWGGGERALE